MFGIPSLWLLLGIGAALIAGVAWHEHRVSAFRSEILTQERSRVALETSKLIAAEAVRAADNAAQSERDASVHEADMAAKDRDVEAANLRIASLEKANKKCGYVSRQTIQKINGR